MAAAMDDPRDRLRQVQEFAALTERVANLIERMERNEHGVSERLAAIQGQLSEIQKQFSGFAMGWGEHMHQSTERDRRIGTLEQEFKEHTRSNDSRLAALDDKVEERLREIKDQHDERLTVLEGFRGRLMAFAAIGGVVAGWAGEVVANWIGSNLHLGR